MIDSVRVDKWLWAVRLYKTRSQAAKDCSSGKIKRQNLSLKPSTLIKAGDLLDVPAADDSHKRHIEVIQTLDKRVGAPLAREAMTDRTSTDVLEEAKRHKADQAKARQHRQEGDQGRMTKKQRRIWNSQIHEFKDA